MSALALIADAPGAPGALESTLDLLADALGATAVAFYVDDPSGGDRVVRCCRPDGGGAPSDEVLVSARIGGQSVGELGVSLEPGEALTSDARALVEGVARVLALVVRNDDLVRGLGDRVRELDRQAAQLGALTRVARRVAESVDEGEVQRVVVSEARALLRAASAALIVTAPDGGRTVVAVDGSPPDDWPDDGEIAGAMAAAGSLRRDGGVLVMVPRRGAQGATPTFLSVTGRQPPFTEADVANLRDLAEHASVALANGRLATGLREEQARQRSLAASIVLAQESERRRVAEDLHDGPVQELVGVGLMLDALSDALDDGAPEIVADVNRAAAAAREAVRALRRAISDLHPMALEELGFAAAVRSLVARIEWQGARVELDLAAADRLSETHRTLAFRIVQEAVANIVRHAEPHLVTIIATEREGSVALVIRDDGLGFDPDGDRPGVGEGHLGLAAAQERATLAGGELLVVSSRGAGTVLTLTLPVEGQSGADQPAAEPPESRSSAAPSAASSAKRSSTTT
jgi:signal transduction histidine kinase